MKLPELPPMPSDDEGQDLGWHALNYRTAHTVHAEAMWKELEQYVRAYALSYGAAVREECAKLAEDMDYSSHGAIAAAIREEGE